MNTGKLLGGEAILGEREESFIGEAIRLGHAGDPWSKVKLLYQWEAQHG